MTDIDAADQPGSPDFHEVIHNREFEPLHREKRSFEFLVGLINNNSKYEVIRSDPELGVNKGIPKKSANNGSTDASKLLLDLLAKIVTYPDQWRQIHEILRNLDQDLISSQHILRQHQQQARKNLEKYNPDSKRKDQDGQNKWTDQTFSTTTNKWPVFDEVESNTVATQTETTSKKQNGDKTSNKKNFSYHKVTGKPAHLKKNPMAYIAVSAISPKPSELEEDFLLESELHQLKPWKNKRSTKRD